MMIENFDSMMAASLQLEEPWYVAGASFDPEKQQMDIWVKVRDHAVFTCPVAGHRPGGMAMNPMSGHGGMRLPCLKSTLILTIAVIYPIINRELTKWALFF